MTASARVFTGLLVLAMLTAAPASAVAKGEDVIFDCAEDGSIDRDYSQEELDEAYDNLPSDIDEYSDCREAIEKARERGIEPGNAAGSPAGGGGTPGRPSGPAGGKFGGSGNDNDELARRAKNSREDKAPEAGVGDEDAVPTGSGSLETGGESDGMPLPLLVVIILAALAGLAGVLYLLRDRLPPGLAERLPGFLKG